MCFDEELPGSLLRCGGFGLRTSWLLDGPATTAFSFGSKLQSEKSCGDTGNVGIAGEFLVLIILVEVLHLRQVRLPIEVDGKGAVPNNVELKFWVAWNWLSSGKRSRADAGAMDRSREEELVSASSPKLLGRLEGMSAKPCDGCPKGFDISAVYHLCVKLRQADRVKPRTYAETFRIR